MRAIGVSNFTSIFFCNNTIKSKQTISHSSSALGASALALSHGPHGQPGRVPPPSGSSPGSFVFNNFSHYAALSVLQGKEHFLPGWPLRSLASIFSSPFALASHFKAYSSLGSGALLSDSIVTSLAQKHDRDVSPHCSILEWISPHYKPASILLRWGLQHGFGVLPKSVCQPFIYIWLPARSSQNSIQCACVWVQSRSRRHDCLRRPWHQHPFLLGPHPNRVIAGTTIQHGDSLHPCAVFSPSCVSSLSLMITFVIYYRNLINRHQ